MDERTDPSAIDLVEVNEAAGERSETLFPSFDAFEEELEAALATVRSSVLTAYRQQLLVPRMFAEMQQDEAPRRGKSYDSDDPGRGGTYDSDDPRRGRSSDSDDPRRGKSYDSDDDHSLEINQNSTETAPQEKPVSGSIAAPVGDDAVSLAGSEIERSAQLAQVANHLKWNPRSAVLKEGWQASMDIPGFAGFMRGSSKSSLATLERNSREKPPETRSSLQAAPRRWFAAARSSSMASGLTRSGSGIASMLSVNTSSLPASTRERLMEIIREANTGRANKTEAHNEILTCRMSDAISAVVIILNVVSMAISVDVEANSTMWFIIDVCFAVFFFCEIVYKLRDVGCPVFFCGQDSRWNSLEMALVALAVLEVITVSISMSTQSEMHKEVGESGGLLVLLRVLRLARVARIARLARLQFFSELLMMLNGALGGIRTLIWSIVLIAIPLFALALVLRETLGAEEDNFASFPSAYLTVFRCMVAADCTNKDGKPLFLLVTLQHGWIYGVLYCMSVVFMTFGLFNIIVAIYVENTLAAAKYNEVSQKRQRLMDEQMFTDKAMELVEFVYRAGAGGNRFSCTPEEDDMNFEAATAIEITPEFFEELRSCKDFQDILRALDIADEDQLDLFDTLDVDGGGTVDMDELVCGIAKLRGEPKRSDIVGVSLMMRSMQLGLNELGAAVGMIQEGLANITSMPELNTLSRKSTFRPRKSVVATRRSAMSPL